MKRGFECVSGYDVELPKRATKKSAGYDFCTIEDIQLNPGEIKLIKTGIKAYMEDDEVLKIFPRSSLSLKKITLPNNVGIIDSDYYNNSKNEGHIFIPLYNFSDEMFEIKKGDKIAQGIFEKFLVIDNEEEIENERNGGFGSTN